MNNLVHQLEQYNIYLNLDNLTFIQILEKGRWLSTILDLDDKITKPPLFYTYKDFVFVDYVSMWYDDYYEHLTTNKVYLHIIKKLMYDIIGKFKRKLYHMRNIANFDYLDSAYILFSINREEYNLLNQFNIECFNDCEMMETD